MTTPLIQLDQTTPRGRILMEAERVFRLYGYGKTTVADIAKELGMSPANIYRFFASKSAIMEAMTEHILATRVEAEQAIANGAGSVAERIRGVLMQEYQHTHETLLCDQKMHEMVTVAIHEQWHVVRNYIYAINRILTDLVEEGIAKGELPEQNAKLSARCVAQCFVSWSHPLMVASCSSDPESARPEQLIDFILIGLTGQRAAATARPGDTP